MMWQTPRGERCAYWSGAPGIGVDLRAGRRPTTSRLARMPWLLPPIFGLRRGPTRRAAAAAPFSRGAIRASRCVSARPSHFKLPRGPPYANHDGRNESSPLIPGYGVVVAGCDCWLWCWVVVLGCRCGWGWGSL